MWSATIGRRFIVVINTYNGKKVMTVWSVINFFHSGRLVGFSDFQRNLRFGSKLADRVAKESRLLECSIFSLVLINIYNEKNVLTI